MVRELKHTEIGDIPVDWELQTFDETFRVISNNTLSRENLNNCGGAVRNIHYGDILTKFPEVLDCNEEEIPYINELSLLSSSTQLLQDGDIVVADTAEDETVGKVIEVQNLGDSKLVAGLHTIPCRVKKGDFAPGWLGYYMNSDLFHNQILPYITGIKVSSISKGAISETLILVPPFDEQEKIVQSLNKIQLLMTAETKVVNKIKLVKNGCLSKMFPQKDDTVPEMRLPGFTEAWEQRKFGELVTIERGGSPRPIDKFITNDENGLNWVKIGDAPEHGNYITQTTEKIRPEGLSKTREVHPGDLILSNSMSFGRPYIMAIDGCIHDGWLAIRDTKKNFELKFLCTLLGTDGMLNQYKAMAAGSTVNNLNKELVGGTTVAFPMMEEQIKIGDYFTTIDHLITLYQCKCDKYSNIKKGMMSDLLTGKIRLV